MSEIKQGDCLTILKTLPDESVNCCITSPPYWGLRNYDVEGQLGLERTPEEYVAKMVEVFREVRRVLRDDGTLWLNLGDSYASQGGSGRQGENGQRASRTFTLERPGGTTPPDGLKPKDLVGIPWRVAFALQADGWYLRQDIIWHKPNPMPESVTDRCTKAHEYIFLLTKSARYYMDMDSVREPIKPNSGENMRAPKLGDHRQDGNYDTVTAKTYLEIKGANRRSVWTIPTQPFKGAHFAVFPEKLVEPCVLAGCPAQVCAKCGSPWERQVENGLTAHDGKTESAYPKGTTANRLALLRQAARERGEEYTSGKRTIGFAPTCACNAGTASGTVLDPFGGSGTVGVVAKRLKRNYILIELKPEYCELARARIAAEPPTLF